jgi:1-piperideine-2-carboxylate/1-pyrroline-2-carboxylate reductase [NAD(P)H]
MMTHSTHPRGIEAPHPLLVCDQARTAAVLDFADLVVAIARAAAEVESGAIRSPERMVVPMAGDGVMLCMPAIAGDIAIHKLANIQPTNATLHLPTLHGVVTVCDTATGKPLCLLDGPEVTGRRTAAVSLLAIQTMLRSAPTDVLIIGTGMQAAYHVLALHSLHPGCKIWVRGVDPDASEDFCVAQSVVHPALACCGELIPRAVQVVITLTTSTRTVYDEAARAGRLVIGVGAFKPDMAELGKVTLDGSDVYADNPVGARHEAGDLIQAGVNWDRVRSLASALTRQPDLDRPIVFKSVGAAAWDLAASRVALGKLGLQTLA